MMDKNSNEHIPCAYCDNDALPGTHPPVCAEHLEQHKEAAENEGPVTLKELDNAD